MRYVEIKIADLTVFRGWTEWVSNGSEYVEIEFLGGRNLRVPVHSVRYIESLPQGHKAIPAWAVKQFEEFFPSADPA